MNVVFPRISSIFDPQAIFSVELLPGGDQAHHKMDCISTTAFIGITHAIGSKIGSSRSCWNRGTEYYPVGMKTHIEYLTYFFGKYNSSYHIEMGTYILFDLLWAGGSVAHAQPTSLRRNGGIFAQTCSTCLKGPYNKDSSIAYPCRAIERAWEHRIPSRAV